MAYGSGAALSKAALVVALLATPVAAQEVTIAALGDSLTAGYGLPPGDGFVPQLEAWLDANGVPARVLNAGVSGDTSAGGLSRIGWTLTPEVDALIVALGGNDLLRGLPPGQTRSNLDAILGAAEDAGLPVLLVGLTAPGNYGPDYKADFEAMFPELAARHGALLYPDFLAAISGALEDGVPLQALIQPDGLHPTAEGVARMVAGIGPTVVALVERAR